MFLLFTSIALLLVVPSIEVPLEGSSRLPTLEEVLDSLLHLIQFFFARYDRINVDGIFGIRTAQYEMIRALVKIDNGQYPAVSPEIRFKMEKIRDLADRTCEKALPEANKQNEQYFTVFSPLIVKPWEAFELKPQSLRKMGLKFLPNRNVAKAGELDEEASDACMQSLMGVGGKTCDVDKCWDSMIKRGTVLYHTTHQVLYFLLGIQFGCQKNFEKKIGEDGSLEEIFQGHCYNIIYQMDTMFRNGKVKMDYQDIFVECGFVCGVLGFMDALNVTWLKEAMTWQDSNLGCFKDRYEDDEPYSDYNEAFARQLDYKKSEWRKRNLLVDAEMGDSCSAHKSGVAAGYLGTHVRLFLEREIINYRVHPAVRFPNPMLYRSYQEYPLFSPLYCAILILFVICFVIVSSRRRWRIVRMICRIKDTKASIFSPKSLI